MPITKEKIRLAVNKMENKLNKKKVAHRAREEKEKIIRHYKKELRKEDEQITVSY